MIGSGKGKTVGSVILDVREEPWREKKCKASKLIFGG